VAVAVDVLVGQIADRGITTASLVLFGEATPPLLSDYWQRFRSGLLYIRAVVKTLHFSLMPFLSLINIRIVCLYLPSSTGVNTSSTTSLFLYSS